ncbi:electron transport complex subunit RsxC [Kosakonia cowanii]|uniref:electron transport complex subunit RsxC n=1 Tax=Kosakonia cowanii TaxID=208223 RepID=UPI00111ED744|nr:electron transport complex subunit RsxC [Kosakonia cowanii]MDP9767818.1 electron transport complex protein RnfC [Atlantibacter hermannii]TPD69133.1 electron transport complex subunit RsxC [Kosakonia cowanii]TPD92169.1 electron transport complex subunit RsxC [Kosakonia cowanii]TPE09160.1 electron transport complex subunit RsxC [Kosakonia cowanii]
MLKLFSAFRKEKLWDFHGGIHPPEMKTQSNGTPLRQLPLASRFVIPLKQHIGAEGELCVSVGDSVLRGQPLTRGRGRMLPVHAPTSGTVVAIAPHATAHPSALPELSVIIEADGEDRWIAREGWQDYRAQSVEALIERIHQFGVAGLGGAGFPTGAKLQGAGDKVDTLIINAAECEPYITADDRLMQDCAAQIMEGVRILAHILQPRQVLIGIEDNKPQAISMMRAVLAGSHDIQLKVIPTKYPSGGAKQLTQILTGKQVPHGGRSSDIGVLMQNVGTAYAVKRAVIDGEPLTERVVTLTGEAVTRPGNVWARLGTPVRHLLDYAGFQPSAEQLVIMGGPLMGFTLPWLDVPVVKITNCLLAPSASEMGETQEEKGCIRCSACADACPADLLPQQLYWFSKGQQHDKAIAHNLSDCIECGACAWVCPSNIPLVQYFRQEKAEISAIAEEERRTAEAKARFEARQARLEREKLARQARHKQAAAKPGEEDKQAIEAALSRVKEKQATAAEPVVVQDGAEPDNREVIAAREARKAEARARQAEKAQQTAEGDDPRKSAVEAAIARAKARKAEHAQKVAAATEPETTELVDPRKAAVEAAIARAKARKAEQAQKETPAAEPEASEPVDPRKAAVEAAIARAKARKAEQAQKDKPTAEPEASESVDPRKAAVEAAIAHAKARKAEQAQKETPAAEPESSEPVDPRKAAVEAAIARAKARKAEQAQKETPVAEPEASEPVDPRKAAVEAAIARAKARKAEQARAQSSAEEASTHTQAANDDPRKAAVAAAIARVQAKKAAQQAVNED